MFDRLFRGKIKTDNAIHKKGEWVQGNFVMLKDGDRLIPHIYGHGEIVEETAGQFTGEHDKKGQKIFEHDIVRVDFEQEYGGLKPQLSYIGVVRFEKGAFCIYKPGSFIQFFFQHGLIKTVIGNIHDNPELLKGGEKYDR